MRTSSSRWTRGTGQRGHCQVHDGFARQDLRDARGIPPAHGVQWWMLEFAGKTSGERGSHLAGLQHPTSRHAPRCAALARWRTDLREAWT